MPNFNMASSSSSIESERSDPDSSPLDTLVAHLLASKRSLSSINHVYRANELVTSTRQRLEKSIITSARTFFLRSGIDSQCKVLAKVRKNTQGVGKESSSEFTSVVRSLDAADKRLKETLDLLRGTMVEASLRPEGEERKNLLDFVDETGVAALMATINSSIEVARKAHDEFRETNEAFDVDLQTVQDLLRTRKKQDIMNSSAEEVETPIPEILHDMEDRAKEMADNLESLVKHFDLCVTAIRHTEGGGDAAQRLADELPEGVDIRQDTPIGDRERLEIMEVLDKDANQVEDVVMEMKDHLLEMEAQYELVTAHTDKLIKEYESTTAAFRLLEKIGLTLPGYITQSHVFLMRWDEDKARIEERMEELEGLSVFYDGFLRAYDNLLIEIGRRKALELKTEKVAQDAIARIQELYEDDAEERDAFKKEQGDFLPSDIWPGLTAGPLQYEIVHMRGIAERVPEVSKSVIQQAIDRVRGRI